ncbi:MAG TPA: outer membrane beta-barrel protein [Chitinophagaceae bacterium]|nr:outer membrane beta-barrel protein [Chitinophagaceae bacterium]
MKKVLLAAIVLMSAQAGFSQISQGQWLVGGTAGFASEKQGSAKSTNITISPNAGYFFIDHFAGGLRVNFTSDKPSGVSATSVFTVAPFVRYYFLPTGQQVNIFADGEYGFGSYKPGGGSSASLNEYKISAGPAIFLTPSAALEFALYYGSAGGKAYGTDRQNTFGLNIGFQIHLGSGSSSSSKK